MGKIKNPQEDSKKDEKKNFPPNPEMENLKNLDPKILEKIPPQIKTHLNEIMKHEKVITEKLKDPKQKKEFLENPYRFFKNNNIPVTQEVEKKMKIFDHKQLLITDSLVMPDGQILKPKINIKIK